MSESLSMIVELQTQTVEGPPGQPSPRDGDDCHKSIQSAKMIRKKSAVAISMFSSSSGIICFL